MHAALNTAIFFSTCNAKSILLLFIAVGSVIAQPFPQLYPQPWVYTQKESPVQVTVDATVRYQTMIGGGCSGAFNVACDQTGSKGLSPSNQQLVSDYLFSENIGGLSILRNRVGSSLTDGILGSCPTTPSSTFDYVGLGANDTTADSCQLKLSQQALKANPNLFIYADAWSAPGCFKTGATDVNGGLICGVRGTNCTHDWRQAYADYLVKYVKFMDTDGYQAKDFLQYLYPTVKKYRKDLQVSCCDATGARQQRTLLYELEQAGGGKLYDVATWHNYQSMPEMPFNTQGQPNLETEWSDGSGNFNTTWDTTGQLAEGLQWAIYMHQAFVLSHTSGYLHWWCAQDNPGNSSAVMPSSSAYKETHLRSPTAMGFCRLLPFRAPGLLTAFENVNGTLAIPVINEAHYERDVRISLNGSLKAFAKATAYLADNTHNIRW
ncbi:glycoside hydrolase superfamily [Bipolaris maydis]|nr:glycoside hydrolase superfamily [Bipolaris maydis]